MNITQEHVIKLLEEARTKLFDRAYKSGVRLAQRPKGIKFDEKGAMLLPDQNQDSETGLVVGQLIPDLRLGRFTPWNLPIGENKICYLESAYNFPHLVICFAQATYVGKVQIQGKFVCLGGVQVTETGPGGKIKKLGISLAREGDKPLLFPVGQLQALQKSRE